MPDKLIVKDNLRCTKVYRTLDQPVNLSIKVTLRKVADRNVPLAKGVALSFEPSRDGKKSVAILPKPLQFVARWQKKVFSPREVKDLANGGDRESLSANDGTRQTLFQSLLNNPKSKEARLVSDPKSEEGQNCIFTYVDSDSFVDEDELTRHTTDAAVEDLSNMAKETLSLGVRKRWENAPDSGKSNAIARRVCPEKKKSFTVMHIMAFLYVERQGKENNGLEEQEVRLCTLKYFDNGVIKCTPGLTKLNEVYQFKINEDVYQFQLENVSQELDAMDEEKEWKIYSEYHVKKAAMKLSNVASEFRPPVGSLGLRVNIFGEIISAANFNGSTLYVRYLLDLGEGWSPDTNEMHLMSGYTQASSCVYNPDIHTWEARFAYPIEAEIISSREGVDVTWPKMFFEICSMDQWDRHVVEGYGYLDIPRNSGNVYSMISIKYFTKLKSGTFTFDIPTWRPSTSSLGRMKSAFVGGSSELEDLAYGAIPTGHKGSLLNKYGFQTETSGTIQVRLNCVQQSSVYSKEKSMKAPASTTTDEGESKARYVEIK
ncbi:Pleiotropic negative transcriptional regulator [Chytridiales sp. JEL 0842]|nr:Pleiotropic negative transcriptional regulator [Chytridiales sp. JEL 0842]